MPPARSLTVLVKGNADIADAVLGRRDGGRKIDRGLADRVASVYPGVEVRVSHHPSEGVAALRAEFAAERSPIVDLKPDVILFSLADDALRAISAGGGAEAAIKAVRNDLVAAVELIKERIGAHVLVANLSTFDPTDVPMNYVGRSEEPFTLRAHRFDLMLVGVSHDEGISIIDIDRVVAELGAEGNVSGPAEYSAAASEGISDEIVRVLEDYGFFDDRPLMAQVGARHSGT